MLSLRTKTLHYNACKQSITPISVIINATARAMSHQMNYFGVGILPNHFIQETRRHLESAYQEIALIINRCIEPAKKGGDPVQSSQLFGLAVDMNTSQRELTICVIHHPLGKYYPQPYRIIVRGYGGQTIREQQGAVTTDDYQKLIREI